MKNNFRTLCGRAHDWLWGDAEERRERELRQRAFDAVQVKEFNGALWLCHNGIPLVKEDWSDLPLAKLAQESRESWVEYKKSRGDLR